MADAPSELPASMEERLESIDAQIAVLLEQVRQLRSKRNNITRISHIPDELLCKIFMEVKGERTTSYPTLQWIWVTHVCRRWRNAAIGFQDLWSDLDSRVGLPWLKVISARSKDVPISCIVASSGRKIIDFLSPTVQELGRITRLILQTNLIAANGLLRGAKGPASLLESLTLDHIGMNHATLPPAFLDIDAPQLKRIALIRCSPSRQWDTNIMKNATHIYLTETRFHPVFDFLEGLAGLRNLVELKLTKLTLDADTAAGETKVVTFPFLKKLHLHDHIVYCAYILKHCRLTRSTELQLDFNTSEDNALELLRSVLSELWMDELPLPNSATSPAPQALRLHLDRYYDETKFIFSGWNEISRQTLQPSEAPSFTIIFSLHVMPTDHISEIIHRIVRLLGWEDVCSLVLPDQLTADPFKDWSTVSVWFPKLQSIDLGHMTRTSFMEWLLSDPLLELIEEPTHDEPETSQATMHVVHGHAAIVAGGAPEANVVEPGTEDNVPAPDAEAIATDADAQTAEGDSPPPTLRFPTLEQIVCRNGYIFNDPYRRALFLKLFAMRSLKGSRLRRLGLIKCTGPTRAMLNTLKQFVDEVIWDEP